MPHVARPAWHTAPRMRASIRSVSAVLAAAALAAAGAGCGDSKTVDHTASSGISADEATTTETTPATTTDAAAPATTDKGAVLPISTDTSKKPSIPKPKGTPPKELVVKDIVEGKGPAAKSGDTVDVQYVGVSYSTGKQFDASWDRGTDPFSFPLGGGQVIPGWDQGVAGMKVGGRRELVIPSELAYGPQGSPPAIGPDETLVFVIDLEKIG